jgi:hypothetical protein
VRFALKDIPANNKLEVHIKNSKNPYRGGFYEEIPSIANVKSDRRYLIVLRIGSEDKFPFDAVYPHHKRCEKYRVTLQDWKEAIIFSVAHEGEHLRQAIKGKRAREDRAERRAYKMLAKFRQRKQMESK